MGDCKFSEELSISVPMEDLENGDVPCIFISAEALLSPAGRDIMKKLRKKTLLVCTDEVHLFTQEQWGNEEFRVAMSRAPGVLASQIRMNSGKFYLGM